MGHGSGSFGHVAAAKHGTINGVSGPTQWKGFCDVSDAASRLNRLFNLLLVWSRRSAAYVFASMYGYCCDRTEYV